MTQPDDFFLGLHFNFLQEGFQGSGPVAPSPPSSEIFELLSDEPFELLSGEYFALLG